MATEIIKVFTAATLSFFIGISITPIFTHFAFKYKWWKKTGSKGAGLGGGATPVFDSLYGNKEAEVKTPRMGGLLIWVSVALCIFILYILGQVVPGDIASKVSFLSRNQTWLPLFTLILGGLIGLANDLLDIKSSERGVAKGIALRWRIVIVLLVGLACGWWFYTKLGVTAVNLPFVPDLVVGAVIVPIFMLFMLGIYSGGVIDGIDGLSGGVFGTMYGAYALIAFFGGQYDIAAFCAAVGGGILAFLWFNIPPARFWMTETGTMALTTTITVVAFLTNSVVPLIIIALPLIVTSLSNIIQVFSKKVFKRKVFRIAPLHHHFEAIGWPSYKVVMRYWIIAVLCAIIGVVVALV